MTQVKVFPHRGQWGAQNHLPGWGQPLRLQVQTLLNPIGIQANIFPGKLISWCSFKSFPLTISPISLVLEALRCPLNGSGCAKVTNPLQV